MCCVGVFRKYDDVICKEPGVFFGSIDFRENRLLALEAMLPRWSGFCSQSAQISDQRLTADAAIAEFIAIVASIVTVPLCEENQSERHLGSFRPGDLTDQDVNQVLFYWFVGINVLFISELYHCKYRQLRSILDLNCNVLSKSPPRQLRWIGLHRL